MSRLLHRLHRDERGMSLVFVGMGFMAFLAASTLAIDVGMFMTARTQAQTAADSARARRRHRPCAATTSTTAPAAARRFRTRWPRPRRTR